MSTQFTISESSIRPQRWGEASAETNFAMPSRSYEQLVAQVLAPGRPGAANGTTGAPANNIVPFNRITPVANPPSQPPVNPATGQSLPAGGRWVSINGGEPTYVPPGESLRSLQRSDFFFALDIFYQRIFQADPNASINGVMMRDFISWRDLSRQGAQSDLSVQQMERLSTLQNRLVDALSATQPQTPAASANRPTSGSLVGPVDTRPAPRPEPVVNNSTLTLQAGDSRYEVKIRTTEENGERAYSLHYQINNQSYAYSLTGRTLAEASAEVSEAFNDGRLPGLAPPARTPVDSPLTLARGDTSYEVNVRNTPGQGFSAHYTINGQNHGIPLEATTREAAADEVARLFNAGQLPGLSLPQSSESPVSTVTTPSTSSPSAPSAPPGQGEVMATLQARFPQAILNQGPNGILVIDPTGREAMRLFNNSGQEVDPATGQPIRLTEQSQTSNTSPVQNRVVAVEEKPWDEGLDPGEAGFLQDNAANDDERNAAADILRQRPSMTANEALAAARDGNLSSAGGGRGNTTGRVATAAPGDEEPALDNVTIVRGAPPINLNTIDPGNRADVERVLDRTSGLTGEQAAQMPQAVRDKLTSFLGEAAQRFPDLSTRITAARSTVSTTSVDNVGATERPTLLSARDRALGELSAATGVNGNVVMRRIGSDIASGGTRFNTFNAGVTIADVQRALPQGTDPAAASSIVNLARELNIDAVQLADRYMAEVNRVTQSVDNVSAQNPVVVNGASDPASVERATEFFTNALGRGVTVPGGWRDVTLPDGRTVHMHFKPELQQTTMWSDIDGVLAPSYGVQAMDVKVELPDGREGYLFIPFDNTLRGTPTQIHGLSYVPGEDAVRVDLDVRDAETGTVARRQVQLPITPEQKEILSVTTNATPTYVEGLAARNFSPQSFDFLRLASKNNERGGRVQGGIQLPSIVLNTFGSMGRAPFENAQELVTSVARSQGFEGTTQLTPGLGPIPGLQVYSGGTSLTQGANTDSIGLSPAQAQGFANVAGAIPGLVDELAAKYGLSDEARLAWHGANFANTPDIPSVILPGQVVSELRNRTQDTHPGRTLADLQREIDDRLVGLLNENGLQDIVTLHHTPTGRSENRADDVRYHVPGSTGDFTTEYQFAVNGQKALPILDGLINNLQANHGFDLKGELEQRGYSYGRIRQMSLEETMTFFRDVVRPLVIDRVGPNATGQVIVNVDTYLERDGRLSGSDASMIRALAALYGSENVTVVQVDTFGGNPPTEPGRNPAFGLGTNAAGQAEVTRPSVDPAGPNAEFAPSVYVARPGELGTALRDALRNQNPLTFEEWERLQNNGRAGDVQPQP